jgi:hypothetical protein
MKGYTKIKNIINFRDYKICTIKYIQIHIVFQINIFIFVLTKSRIFFLFFKLTPSISINKVFFEKLNKMKFDQNFRKNINSYNVT